MTREELLKTAKPILFNTETVRSILDGRKSVTRRVVKGVPNCAEKAFKVAIETKGYFEHAHKNGKTIIARPPYKVGDILYVRETWGISTMDYDDKMIGIIYKASENEKECGYRNVKFPNDKFEKLYNSMAESSPDWRPSIHMPKEAARIFLRVKSVRVERLQDITKDGIIAEGAETDEYLDYEEWATAVAPPGSRMITLRDYFSELWNSTVKKSDLDKYGWDANPWVYVIEFERVKIND